MGSSAKVGKICIRGSQEQKRCTFLGPKYKSAFWDRTPPSLYLVQVGSGVTNLQTELNYLDSFKTYCNFLIWVYLALGGGAVGWGVPGVINYSLYDFRNVLRWRIFKQNQNILISSRLIEFWCFGLPVALRRGRWVGVSGAMGGIPTHVHMHMHAHTCTHAHVCMYRNCKWLLTWRHPCLSCLACMWMCGCMHACA